MMLCHADRRRCSSLTRAAHCVLVSLFGTLFLPWAAAAAEGSSPSILVVGSANADTFLPVSRLPVAGENLTLRPGCVPRIDVPGGKGCTQAVAAAKLSEGNVLFLGQFGNDSAGEILMQALKEANVDITRCQTHLHAPTGRGYVLITESGLVSAIVSGGTNFCGWRSWEEKWQGRESDVDDEYFDRLLEGVDCVMLQREVPEHVNLLMAKQARKKGILVFQDVGGEDRPIDQLMLASCDFIIPNESELKRLVRSIEGEVIEDDGDELEMVIEKIKLLQEYGARNVLVTRGARGSVLVSELGDVWQQEVCQLPKGSKVVDETGAGDCFRAAFAVSLLEGKSIKECLEFASAAGALSVTVQGAVPSAPSLSGVRKLQWQVFGHDLTGLSGGGDVANDEDDECPLMFGSRLNSMKDRPDLWPEPLSSVRDYVRRQATVQGLGCCDFNYPQHFHTWTVAEAKQALDEAGLIAGAVCLRYPKEFARGAMNHPNLSMRREAIQLTKEAAEVARELGCNEVVVWSAFDGYDYPFQVNYDDKWSQLIAAFQECCDEFPNIKFSLEFKPTDENTRFFTVPSTGAALLLIREIDRPNMGLTLDVGHMLMAGENPGQSIALVGDKLFGIQLNDGYTRLAAEDGLMFGSVHPAMALEVIYQLQRMEYNGHLYFDTFPQRVCPVKEAEYNIKQVKAFWKAARRLDKARLRDAEDSHDAITALDLVNDALRSII